MTDPQILLGIIGILVGSQATLIIALARARRNGNQKENPGNPGYAGLAQNIAEAKEGIIAAIHSLELQMGKQLSHLEEHNKGRAEMIDQLKAIEKVAANFSTHSHG